MVGQISHRNILHIMNLTFAFYVIDAANLSQGFADFPFRGEGRERRVSKYAYMKIEIKQDPIFQFCFIGPAMKAAGLYSLIEGFGFLSLKEMFWKSLQHKSRIWLLLPRMKSTFGF